MKKIIAINLTLFILMFSFVPIVKPNQIDDSAPWCTAGLISCEQAAWDFFILEGDWDISGYFDALQDCLDGHAACIARTKGNPF